jgi:hypothetical protein
MLTHLRSTARTSRGQAIVLVALMMVVLLGLTGVAVDISSAYSQYRFEKSVADAAALSGGQDLQQPGGSRIVTDVERTSARARAMELLVGQLGATSTPSCPTSADIVDCALPGTDYVVSIKTPSPTCVDCDPNRSVQVTVELPNFGIFFPRIFGQSEWAVGATAVAGINSGIRYAVVTLRPGGRLTGIHPCNVNVSGNTALVRVENGDIGSNRTACTSGSGAYIELEPGFRIFHHMPLEPWRRIGIEPQGILLQLPIDDPDYITNAELSAIRSSMTAFASQAGGEDPGCAQAAIEAPGATIPAGARCYRPGVYPRIGGVAFSVNPSDTAFLYPGVYHFDGEVTIQGVFIGGNVSKAAQPNGGVTIIAARDKAFNSQGAGANLSLNRGPAGCASSDCRAGPAIAPNGHVMVAPDGTPITIVVPKYDCFDGQTPRDCTDTTNDTKNKTINLRGGGLLELSGVIYAPTDQVRVESNNAAQDGTVGQIISWTVEYGGNAGLNQQAFTDDTPGILRLDAACSRAVICTDP